jgi:hypothetical protein
LGNPKTTDNDVEKTILWGVHDVENTDEKVALATYP